MQYVSKHQGCSQVDGSQELWFERNLFKVFNHFINVETISGAQKHWIYLQIEYALRYELNKISVIINYYEKHQRTFKINDKTKQKRKTYPKFIC